MIQLAAIKVGKEKRNDIAEKIDAGSHRVYVIEALPRSTFDEYLFSLTLKLYKDNVKLGSVIKGEIILTNISGREITVYSDRSRYAHPSGFTINLIDDHGKTPALTDAGSVVIGSGGDQRVPPNGTIEYKLDIQKLYNIVTPGEYHVQAQIIDGKANQLVKSNTVNIAVTR